jgi:hypothetical protein
MHSTLPARVSSHSRRRDAVALPSARVLRHCLQLCDVVCAPKVAAGFHHDPVDVPLSGDFLSREVAAYVLAESLHIAQRSIRTGKIADHCGSNLRAASQKSTCTFSLANRAVMIDVGSSHAPPGMKASL